MRTAFPGYFRPTEQAFKELWSECFFTFDASTLLNLYRYSPETRTELASILERVRDRCWIPHQVALELLRNRLSVLSVQEKSYETTIAELAKVEKFFATERHPFLSEKNLQSLRQAIAACNCELTERQGELRKLVQDDRIAELIATLFEGKVGAPYDDLRTTDIYREGATRYEKQIPPGYSDEKKGDERKYGDLIVWFQLLDEAKKRNRPLILVTDDSKEDWWLEHRGQTLGPRPELITEAREKVQVQFWAYTPDRFMEFAKRFLDQDVKQEAINEVKEVAELDKRTWRADDAVERARRAVYEFDPAKIVADAEWARRAAKATAQPNPPPQPNESDSGNAQRDESPKDEPSASGDAPEGLNK